MTDREAFEEWHGGRYRGLQADIAWAAWQAAIAQRTEPQQQAEPVSEVTGLAIHHDGFRSYTISPPAWPLEVGAKLYAAPPAAQAEPVANAMRCDFCNINFADRQPGTVCPKCYRELSRIIAAPPADDEAVRLLRGTLQYVPAGDLWSEIDAYLAKVKM